MSNFWQELPKPILALAPMAGITDSAFRTICKKYGADVTYSEMASVSALYFKPQKTLELVRYTQEESPYVVQLFGKDPKHFAKATQIITSLTGYTGFTSNPGNQFNQKTSQPENQPTRKPDGIDINFGCPAKKVFGHGSGCALMPQKELAREIILAVCDNTDLPVSIKIRAGLKNMTAIEFIKNTSDLPYSAVMIHGRTYEGSFSGTVDFKMIEEIKKIIPDKIVLANGGIYTPEDGVKVLKNYPLIDGLGIARGAWGKPFLFQQIKDLLSKDKYTQYDFSNIKKIMIDHAEFIYKDKEKLGLFEIRKHMSWYVKGFPGASELRRKLVLANSLEEIKSLLNH